ncbi:hypothetical protein LBW12_05400 [Latilactobacillus curvatus]|uniref:hypothetical protein n=1 Tax=Latilactobacillus curvatus TaxID=28038 RepID=UPI0020C82C90|nr:hypothetical protein [Latilactobacillus curvatus]MCP8859459.1 hypothetical protein [Latilactobacillus curvatus]
MGKITSRQLYVANILNFFLLLLEHWLMTRFFGISSNMAWVLAMFLMAVFECDEFMYLHWDKRGNANS